MSEAPIYEARGIARTFGSVQALQGADFDVRPGEVSALIGDNGAGKSTLVRILAGADSPNAGQLYFDGRPLTLTNPTDARELGIETVFQDLALANHLNPIQNMYLGREVMRRGLLGKLGFMERNKMRNHGAQAFADLGATVRDYDGPVGGMSGGQRQAIAVARAAAWASKVIFLDEPTAALGVVQTKGVLDLVRRIRDTGLGVVLISHSMPEVLQVSDRIHVLRHGRRVALYKSSETNVDELVGAMTGALDERDAA
ncbi:MULTISPECIES: ATP-binding cassette domain-containing protein [unclassified Pseudactinotalea]|uniref:ATP-binding cassette domain-containing protein n=1 Tax=unclassified Pseudactinotalea TaxID=2649176 RepID=UPI00128B7344|nr:MULTISPECIES: ATP-binding cassette domain-containing protein [unclassified Pseudactinotalea]MPV49675.1 ATP-binding cassette domain-containing protein [Pseudactinotalea sp. HY160]QGH69642.1 ATP-binding cassette domain-containing protein [Pseudactinotalea sp. HY158]